MNTRTKWVGGILSVAWLLAAGTTHAATNAATWVGSGGAAGANWADAAQWNPNTRYPDNGQPAGDDLYNVTFGNIANTAILNQNIAINTLTFNGTAITNAGNTLTVNGSMTWGNYSANRPQFTGTGILEAKSGIAFNPAGNGSGSPPNLWNSWTINLYANSSLGNSSGWYIRNTGTINVQPSATFSINGNEASAIGYSGTTGTVNILSGGTLNRITATQTTKVDNVVNNLAGGTVNVATGGLHLAQGGTQGGSFTVASGSLLQFGGAHTFNSGSSVSGAGNVTFTGPSTFSSGATFTPGGNVTINGVAVSFADTTTLAGSLTVVNNFQLSATGDLNVAGKFNWQLSAGGSGSSLTGAGVLNALGGMGVSGYYPRYNYKTINLYGASSMDGTLGGGEHTFRNNATINIQSGGTLDIIGSAFELGFGGTTTGTVNVLNGGVLNRSTATTTNQLKNIVNNQAGGTVNVVTGGLHLVNGGTHAGSFTVAPASLLQFSGTHAFNSGATVTGNGNVTLTGPATLNPGSSLNIGGNARVENGAPLTVDGGTTIGGTLYINSSISGAGDITVSNTITLYGDTTLTLSGAGVVNALGGLSYNHYWSKITSKTINFYGTSLLEDPLGHSFQNSGAWNIRPGASLELRFSGGTALAGAGTINNSGTLWRASYASGGSVANTLNNTGTVRTDAGGKLDFSGTITQLSGTSITGGTWYANNGTINLPGSALVTIGPAAVVRLSGTGVINRIGTSLTTVNGGFYVEGGKGFNTGSGLSVGSTGTLGGDGAVTGNVTVAGGTLAPGPNNASGKLTLVGNVNFQTGSTVRWDKDATTQDVVAVTGTLTLPTVASVIATNLTGAKLRGDYTLLTATTLAGETNTLAGWTVQPDDYRVAFRNGNEVYLYFSPAGTALILQ